VVEEPEETANETSQNQMYEKIIDEMDVDEGNAQDVNEDELLKDEPEEQTPAQPQTEEKPESDEKIQADDENRGIKRRSDSPNKGNTPKKRQRLPPPNIEDFVNDEDEPELDESTLQLSWCKFSTFLPQKSFKINQIFTSSRLRLEPQDQPRNFLLSSISIRHRLSLGVGWSPCQLWRLEQRKIFLRSTIGRIQHQNQLSQREKSSRDSLRLVNDISKSPTWRKCQLIWSGFVR
jgi:hypothetical protein